MRHHLKSTCGWLTSIICFDWGHSPTAGVQQVPHSLEGLSKMWLTSIEPRSSEPKWHTAWSFECLYICLIEKQHGRPRPMPYFCALESVGSKNVMQPAKSHCSVTRIYPIGSIHLNKQRFLNCCISQWQSISTSPGGLVPYKLILLRWSFYQKTKSVE